MTPNQRHQGLDDQILNQRESIYELAKAKNPFRWSGETRNWKKENKVYLNPLKQKNGSAICNAA